MRMLFTVDETAEALGISRSKVYALIAEGRLSAVAIGKSRRVSAEAIEAFITSLSSDGTPERATVTPKVPTRQGRTQRGRSRGR